MSQKKPGWLPENAFAGPRGWTVKHPSGLEEVLLAARGLTVTSKETVVPVVVPTEEPVVPEVVVESTEEVLTTEPAKIKLFKPKK
jgi:hypothetical protein